MTIGIIGCGFWANYQVAAWREADPHIGLVFCDQNIESARKMAENFGSSKVHDDIGQMLATETLDLIDIITPPDSHAEITYRVLQKGVPIVCQKPMAPNLPDAQAMVDECARHKVPLFVHENFRWQKPLRHLKQKLDSGVIGTPFRARIYFNSGFPVFENQPLLAELDRFIIADLGVHLLDVCRFLFGEATSVYGQIQRVNPKILGEDVATLMLRMESGMVCNIELSYASTVSYECFPQTLAEVEGDKGALSLLPNYSLVTTTKAGTSTETTTLPNYLWVHPQYVVAQSAMVATHENFLAAVRDGVSPETTGADNLKTLKLMHAAYQSAETNRVVDLLEA